MLVFLIPWLFMTFINAIIICEVRSAYRARRLHLTGAVARTAMAAAPIPHITSGPSSELTLRSGGCRVQMATRRHQSTDEDRYAHVAREEIIQSGSHVTLL